MIEDINRRTFLVKLLGIPAALMALEHDPAFSSKQVNLVLNDDPMSFLEDIVATRWKMHLMGGPLKGVDALLLRDYDRALRLIDKSLKSYNPTQIPARARFLARKAEACYGLRMMDECLSSAETAFTLAKSVGASNTIARVNDLHASLARSSWQNEPGVRRLGALLATV